MYCTEATICLCKLSKIQIKHPCQVSLPLMVQGRHADRQGPEAGAQMCALMPDSNAVICVLDISRVTAIVSTLTTISVLCHQGV